jgi:hypothetical protein
MLEQWTGPILIAATTALLAAVTYFVAKRVTTPRRAKALALTSMSAGILFIIFQTIDVLGINPSDFKRSHFFFLVLLPLVGSALEWRWLFRLAQSRSDTGRTISDLGRAPGWSAAYVPLMGALAYVSGQLPHAIKNSHAVFQIIPMVVLAASSVISAIVTWKSHTRITENGIWTGRGFMHWHDVDEWYFKTVAEREVMFITKADGLVKEKVIVNVSESQKTALAAALKQRVPHLEKRYAVLAQP